MYFNNDQNITSGWNGIWRNWGPSGIAYIEMKNLYKEGGACEKDAPKGGKHGFCVKALHSKGANKIEDAFVASGAGIFYEDPERDNRFFLIGIMPKDEKFLKRIQVYVPNIVSKKALKFFRKRRQPVKKCKYKPMINDRNCGVSKVFGVFETAKLGANIHPWQVTIYINWKKNKGLKKSSEPSQNKNLICQGVLVSTQHVLTAYHCLVDKAANSGIKRNL